MRLKVQQWKLTNMYINKKTMCQKRTPNMNALVWGKKLKTHELALSVTWMYTWNKCCVQLGRPMIKWEPYYENREESSKQIKTLWNCGAVSVYMYSMLSSWLVFILPVYLFPERHFLWQSKKSGNDTVTDCSMHVHV